MPTAATTDKRAQATHACEALVGFPGVRGILLFGSVARGDATRSSDIDLIVLGSDADVTSSQLRRHVAQLLRSDDVAVSYHTASTLQIYLERWSRFGAHLRMEGQILYDADGELTRILSLDRPVNTAHEFASQRRHLERYAHADRFGGRFLLPLAHMYRIGRATAFAATAKAGELEFDRRRAAALAAELYPEFAAEFATIDALAPFYDRVRNPESLDIALPFDPAGAEGERRFLDARDAIGRVLEIGERG